MASEINDRDSADSFLLSMSSGRTPGISRVTVIDGIDNYDLFEWIYNQVKEKVPFLQYYKGPDSHKLKRYQMGRAKSQVKLVLIYFKTFTF